MMRNILILTILGLLGACQSSRNEGRRTFVSSTADLQKLRKDTLPCGQDGQLLTRINDCRRTNPHIATYRTIDTGVSWHQVMFDKKNLFHLWLDTSQNLLWSSPINPKRMDFCHSALNFKNGNKELTVRWARIEEYRKLFEYQIPPLLYSANARFFKHNDHNVTKMAVDEKEQKFRNLPDDMPVWVRCIAE